MGKAVVIVCGKEEITLSRPGLRAIGLAKDDTERDISYDEYSKWFTITATDPGASTKCGIMKGKDGILIGGNTLSVKGDVDAEIKFDPVKGLVIDVQKVIAKKDHDFSVRVSTIGGKKAVQKLVISQSCEFKATPIPGKNRVVQAFEKDKHIDFIKPWKDAFTLSKGDGKGATSTCEFNSIYQYKKKDSDYKDWIADFDYTGEKKLPLT